MEQKEASEKAGNRFCKTEKRSLETIAKSFIKKHHVASVFIGLKIIDIAIFAGFYAIWPEETRGAIYHSYQLGKEFMPSIAICSANYSKEIVYAASNLGLIAGCFLR